jgi:AcrR family transcriptional regulator
VVTRTGQRRASVRLPRERRVSDILAAARAVFCTYGYTDSAVSEIAARAEVVEGTIYKYFESKRELLMRVLEGWYEGVLADHARELPGIRGPQARLRYVIWRHLRAVRDDPQLARLMFLEVRAHEDYPGSTLYALNRRYTGLLAGVLAEGAQAGELRADAPVRVVRDLVYGGIEHLTWRYVSGRGGLDVDRETDDLLRVLWDGIAAPGVREAAGTGSASLRRQVLRLERVADRLEGARAAARR